MDAWRLVLLGALVPCLNLANVSGVGAQCSTECDSELATMGFMTCTEAN
eukprot:CAMPEP_0198690860 /NCGR_PEP_ID=MMETSP1468-20131203/188775_1 /TAXON_ID=1461545 /ORGANISM="Mantoniella sp, Strain CCMP1436" /LENGTH=48 /DNA_ID= /DNA_START= /DNA_END= /DNA_ORIENTATION=